MKLFLCEPIHPEAYQLLKKEFDIVNDIKNIKDCEIIINRNITMNKDFLSQCSSLKLVIIHGSGYDDVDIEYLRKHHIQLVNTPGLNALSVSELIISFMLQLSRNIPQLCHDFSEGMINEVAPIDYLGNEISYKTFGMIGVGHIALKTAKILKEAFHMNVIGYSRSLTQEKAKQEGIGYCHTIDEVLQSSDFVSLGTSLTTQTYHMISKKELELMKPTAFLINTSRGAIINENDLYEALLNKTIAGAGLDVLENEPVPCHHHLISLPNVIYTPHIGGSTYESLKRIGMEIYRYAMLYKNGELCEDILNL